MMVIETVMSGRADKAVIRTDSGHFCISAFDPQPRACDPIEMAFLVRQHSDAIHLKAAVTFADVRQRLVQLRNAFHCVVGVQSIIGNAGKAAGADSLSKLEEFLSDPVVFDLVQNELAIAGHAGGVWEAYSTSKSVGFKNLERLFAILFLTLTVDEGRGCSRDRSSSSITAWVSALQRGNENAAAGLFQRIYADAVVLSGNVISADWAEDVAQSVVASVCVDLRNGGLTELESRNDLWRVIVDRVFERSKKANTQSHPHIDDGVSDAKADKAYVAVGFVLEECEQLLALLRDDTMRQIAVAILAGRDCNEIAHELSVCTRTVERKVRLIEDKWVRSLTPD